jgi:hypothetical protein
MHTGMWAGRQARGQTGRICQRAGIPPCPPARAPGGPPGLAAARLRAANDVLKPDIQLSSLAPAEVVAHIAGGQFKLPEAGQGGRQVCQWYVEEAHQQDSKGDNQIKLQVCCHSGAANGGAQHALHRPTDQDMRR